MPRKKKVVAEVPVVPEVKKEVRENKIVPETVFICRHCGSLTFYNTGKCKWCYKDLSGSEQIK
jgi:RNase P subunit RPR2